MKHTVRRLEFKEVQIFGLKIAFRIVNAFFDKERPSENKEVHDSYEETNWTGVSVLYFHFIYFNGLFFKLYSAFF